jgi:hypothetical protein
MNTKLIVGMAALLLAAPAAMASDYYRSSLGPTTANVTGVASVGVSFCHNELPVDPLPGALCGTGGVGAIIALDGSAGEKDLNPATKVSGDCTVSLSVAIGGLDGNFTFSCGVDRDDDGFVTNVDASSTEVRETDGTKYDDDSTADVAGGTTATVCFREDIGDIIAGSGFDEMAVFIAINVPSTDVGAGTFDINVNLASGTCSPSSF